MSFAELVLKYWNTLQPPLYNCVMTFFGNPETISPILNIKDTMKHLFHRKEKHNLLPQNPDKNRNQPQQEKTRFAPRHDYQSEERT
jgi:hypothetical protein